MNVDVPPIQDETHCSSPTDVEETRPKQISSIWNHFERHQVDGKWKAACNYCGKQLLGDPSQGTKHLHNHFKSYIR
ncbi:putative transcription factor/ chromatin remodeling BED-type(Zn) family [Lupinus albus]|uniref:Putative transcription factor/ chromatin remodeling BED-type(Zn) family n=1 Tax=Lupinus albus TaxID=3870 RepID=A0A6A4NMK6_LUPAL|nr:putative transcription factor/ chromatin remodeling BED-type(Zn) family [Lupinus albus]